MDMKKVVIKQVVAEVSIKDLSVKKYYGVKENLGIKGFITQSDFDTNRFVALCTDEVTRGNNWPAFDGCRSLKTLTEKLIKAKFEVYEFETYKELFKWLSE